MIIFFGINHFAGVVFYEIHSK